MLEQISDRFKSIENFRVFSVLNFDLFENHNKRSPDKGPVKLKIQEKLDGPFVDIIRLTTGLNVMYRTFSSEFRRKHF